MSRAVITDVPAGRAGAFESCKLGRQGRQSSTRWGRLLFLATLQVSRRSTLLRPTAVNTVLADIRQAQARGQTVVSLMRGEPDFDTPAHIIEAATRAMKGGRTRYPDNRGEIVLRQAVAEKLSRENGVTYDPAHRDPGDNGRDAWHPCGADSRC